MRAIIFFAVFFIATNSVFAQDTLYYFYANKDSTLVGVKNQKGEIIISPIKTYIYYDRGTIISEETIDFEFSPSPFKGVKNSPVMPVGAVYNRKGEYLYSAQFYDNAMDFWSEELRRYAENNKIGFVNRSGEKILPAQWDFASPFHYGYASVCEGNLSRVYDESGEHWTISGDTAQYLINRKGERVDGYAEAKHPKDYFYNNKYYPYPFEYSQEEKEILSSFEKDIIGISFLFDSNSYKYAYSPVQLEIIGRPNNFKKHYVITVYDDRQSQIYNSEFFVDWDKKESYIIDYDQNKIPLKKAILKKLESFIALKDREVLPETRKLAQEELQRLKSQP